MDGAAGAAMAAGQVDAVIVGCDRVAANGDTANKIGTYALAVLARHHGIPFLVAGPLSTFDPATPDGAAIVIEERDADEVRTLGGRPVAPPTHRRLEPGLRRHPGRTDHRASSPTAGVPRAARSGPRIDRGRVGRT